MATVPLLAVPALGSAAPAASAAEFELLPPGPARVLTLSLLPGGNNDDLRGVLCETPRTCQTVDYSYFFRPTGVANLQEALHDGTTGQQIVFAYSQGARVVALWLEETADDLDAPSPEDLSFVLMGNPVRKYGGADREWQRVMPETEYKILDVTRQYDGASDFPDNPFNLLALMNANMALLTVHQDYEDVDIYDPANYVWTEGSTTYVFVPTKNLPLLDPLRWIGLSGLADALNGPLKEIVERGYNRDYLPALPGPPVEEQALVPEPPAPAKAVAFANDSRIAVDNFVNVVAGGPAKEDTQEQTAQTEKTDTGDSPVVPEPEVDLVGDGGADEIDEEEPQDTKTEDETDPADEDPPGTDESEAARNNAQPTQERSDTDTTPRSDTDRASRENE